MRIGQGYDVHAFEAGDHVMIGGVRIAHNHGLKAHSDGDVLLHAICDALLGAAGLGDIGKHFPDTQAEFKGISSITLLSHVVQQLSDHGYSLLNIDSTVVAQAPKLSPHIDDMREVISQACGLKATAVNVKATTTERLGFCGREEGIAAHAVCLIQPRQ